MSQKHRQRLACCAGLQTDHYSRRNLCSETHDFGAVERRRMRANRSLICSDSLRCSNTASMQPFSHLRTVIEMCGITSTLRIQISGLVEVPWSRDLTPLDYCTSLQSDWKSYKTTALIGSCVWSSAPPTWALQWRRRYTVWIPFVMYTARSVAHVWFINNISSRLLSKKLKVNSHRTIILQVVLHHCQTLSLTLREEHRLRVFENKVLRKIFGAKKD